MTLPNLLFLSWDSDEARCVYDLCFRDLVTFAKLAQLCRGARSAYRAHTAKCNLEGVPARLNHQTLQEQFPCGGPFVASLSWLEPVRRLRIHRLYPAGSVAPTLDFLQRAVALLGWEKMAMWRQQVVFQTKEWKVRQDDRAKRVASLTALLDAWMAATPRFERAPHINSVDAWFKHHGDLESYSYKHLVASIPTSRGSSHFTRQVPATLSIALSLHEPLHGQRTRPRDAPSVEDVKAEFVRLHEEHAAQLVDIRKKREAGLARKALMLEALEAEGVKVEGEVNNDNPAVYDSRTMFRIVNHGWWWDLHHINGRPEFATPQEAARRIAKELRLME
jgi:hypothetical protein